VSRCSEHPDKAIARCPRSLTTGGEFTAAGSGSAMQTANGVKAEQT
jgi:hypothetical protein